MNQWQTFFKTEAANYLENCFTKNTVAECDFIERELKLKKGQSILDIGCGAGRHSLELTRRGYRCTGIDQSAEMLAIARSMAEKESLSIEFVQGDASTTRLGRQFDHAICLCEGAFSLVEAEVNPVQFHAKILSNIAAMLKPESMFLLTCLNGYRFIRQSTDAEVASGDFDPLFISKVTHIPDTELRVIEKGFTPIELIGLLENADFYVLELCGGTAGSWDKHALKLDEIEMMALCQKAPAQA